MMVEDEEEDGRGHQKNWWNRNLSPRWILRWTLSWKTCHRRMYPSSCLMMMTTKMTTLLTGPYQDEQVPER